jgi:hypothetical protein
MQILEETNVDYFSTLLNVFTNRQKQLLIKNNAAIHMWTFKNTIFKNHKECHKKYI